MTADPGGTSGSASGPSSNWWSDALNDPWRDPASPSMTVATSAAPEAPEPEVVAVPQHSARLVVLVAMVVGLLAGSLGGAVGYLAATNDPSSRVVLGGGSQAVAPSAQRDPGSVSALVARVMPSVVTVEGSSLQGETLGSGFVIAASGYILTNEHVLAEVPDGAVRVTLSDTTTLAARVVGRDPESDVAVLKVNRDNLRPVEFADSDSVVVGDAVIAIGAPLALTGTVTTGIVSALDRTIETQSLGGVQRYYAAIQTDAAVNRGNSGGPLFDSAGRVIGINSVIKSIAEDGAEAGNIGIAFAIPINQAGRVAAEIIDTGKARRTVIGAQITADRGVGRGVRLTTVEKGGPAATGGLRAGDVVIRLGTHRIEQPRDLIALVRRYDPGTVITVIYRRGSTTGTATITLVADAN